MTASLTLDPSLRDNESASRHVKRSEPRVLNFRKLREEPTREEIMLTSLARSLRGMLEQGRISQSEVDRQLDEYRQRLQRNPFPSDLQVFMNASKRLDRDAIIRENPLLEYCESLGWAIKRDGPNGRFKCICPFHSEDTPSFTIYSKENKAHCFGCGKHATVIDVHMLTRGLSVGEAMRDLWTRHHRSELSESVKNDEKTPSAKKKEEVFHYDYHDAKGEMVFQVVKTVRPGRKNKYKQRRRVDGRWIDNIEGVERVPYRLPELLANPTSVWVVEGEKDVETLRAARQTATCNSEGAGKWRQQEHSEALRGLHVWLVPDSDEVGRDHARKVFASLDGVAATVTWLDLPSEFDGHRIKDVSDLRTACDSEDAFLEALEKLQQQASQRKSAGEQEISELLSRALEENEKLLREYVVFPSEDVFVVLAIWVAHSWSIDAFDFTPYLHVHSPVKECGKSRLFEVLKAICKKSWYTISPTEAVLFRMIHACSPTLLLDEVDTIFKDKVDPSKEGVRAVLNAGYERGASVPRCHGPNQELKHFDVFGVKAFAGIGNIPDTVASRSIKIAMARRKKSQKIKRLRKRELVAKASPNVKTLREWSENLAVISSLRNARPALPEELGDRGADICEPLLAIADMAGGEWPKKLRDSLKRLMKEGATVDNDVKIQLLSSIREVFTARKSDSISTEDLLKELVKQEGESWGAWWSADVYAGNIRGPASKLAKMLKDFPVAPKTIREGEGTSKGYSLEAFSEHFERYLPHL